MEYVHDSIHVSIPALLCLGIFGTGKCVNHWGDYGLEVPVNAMFCGTEKVIKLAEK